MSSDNLLTVIGAHFIEVNYFFLVMIFLYY